MSTQKAPPKKGSVLKIPLVEGTDGLFRRPTWFGVGPFEANINRETGDLTFKGPDGEAQIVPPKEGQYGTIWQVSLFQGLALVSLSEHSQYGTSLRFKLGEKTVLPEIVKEKIKGPADKQYGNKSAPAKPTTTTSFKKQPGSPAWT